MSGDSWLFLFAAIGAVGGIAQIAQLYFQIWPPSPPPIPPAADGGEIMTVAQPKGVFVSKARLGSLALVMILSGGLAIWGLVRSVRSEQPSQDIIGTFNASAWAVNVDPITRAPRSVFVDVQIASVGPKAKDYNLVAISRAAYDQVDGMRDTLIDKSEQFSIGVGIRRIEFPLSSESVRRIAVGHNVDIWVVALPVEFSPRQVMTLASLNQLGGLIVIHRAIGVPKQ